MSTQSNLSLPETQMPFGNTINNASSVAQAMALSVLLLLHTDIGIDRLTNWQLAFMTGMMMAGSFLGNIHFGFSLFGGFQVLHGDDNSLRNFALLVLALGIWQRREWHRKATLGTEGHSYSPGEGRLCGIIPLARKYVDMLVQPFLVFLAGAVSHRLGFGLLGLWLMASAVALGITEKLWQVRIARLIRQSNNSGKEAVWLAEYERTRRQAVAVKDDAASPSVTIPTGNDDGLAALIEKNKRDNSFLN